MAHDLQLMTAHTAVCDRCDREDEADSGTKSQAVSELKALGWVHLPDAPHHHRQFCPACAPKVVVR